MAEPASVRGHSPSNVVGSGCPASGHALAQPSHGDFLTLSARTDGCANVSQVKPLTADTKLMRRAMRDLVYGSSLDLLMRLPERFQIVPTASGFNIQPFYFLHDTTDLRIRGTSVELSYYLAHRLEQINKDGQFSEPYTFAVVKGRCGKYFHGQNAEHIFIVGWKDRDEIAARTQLSNFMHSRAKVHSKKLIILDPTFRAVCSLRARARYEAHKELFDTVALPRYRPDPSVLVFRDSQIERTQWIPLGHMRSLVTRATSLRSPPPRSIIYFSILREGLGKEERFSSSLGVQRSPDSSILPIEDQKSFLSELPPRNPLLRFIAHTDRQLALYSPLPWHSLRG